MLGNIGSLNYIADKKTFIEALGGKIEFEIYKNKFSEEFDITDYKDWQVC